MGEFMNNDGVRKFFAVFISALLLLFANAAWSYGDYATQIFVFLTLAGAVWLVVFRKKSSTITNYASTMGVLGTFVGIFMGLSDFDVADIQSSIPPLLEGLKTAFITSIVGMTVALIIKLFYKEPASSASPIVVEDTQTKELLSILLAVAKDIRDNAIAGNESLLKEMVAIRETQKACTQDIEMKIEKFGQIVAEQSSKELIGALQKVMEDFNEKINDQLGQSFNDLTESCKNLNKWQQEHVELLKEMEQYNKKVLDYLIASDGFLAKFDETQKIYRENSKELRNEIMHLGRFIARITELGEKFDKTMPLIEIRMDENTQRISDIIKVFNVQAKNVLESQTEMNGKMNNAMQTFSNHLVGVLQNFHNRITEVQNNRFR